MNKTNKILITLTIALGLFIGFSACKKDYIDYAKLAAEEVQVREHYLADNYETVEVEDTVNGGMVTAIIYEGRTIAPTSTGLYYIETKEGDGIKPTIGRLITVSYKGSLLDGTEFDSNDWWQQEHGKGIKGWVEGIGMMRKGGTAILIIPSELAYGSQETANIPRYSTLIFEVELINAQ